MTKTMDEVIKVMDHVEFCCTNCKLQFDCDEVECFLEDALHYLKEYRSEKAMWEVDRKGLLDWIEQYKEAREKHQQAVIELKKNPPLTWDELRQMEGMPVWMEWNYSKGWRLVNCFDSTVSDEKAVALTDRFGVDFVFSAETFAKCEVMVYRREKK